MTDVKISQTNHCEVCKLCTPDLRNKVGLLREGTYSALDQRNDLPLKTLAGLLGPNTRFKGYGVLSPLQPYRDISHSKFSLLQGLQKGVYIENDKYSALFGFDNQGLWCRPLEGPSFNRDLYHVELS